MLATSTPVDLKPIPVEVCVRALEAFGFQIKQRGNGFTVLRMDERVVVVPSIGILDVEMQQAILRSANITEGELRRLVALQSGIFTRQDLDDALATKRG